MTKVKHLYRDIFKRALFVTWRNPFMWLLGLFVTFLGIGNIYELMFKNALEQNLVLERLGLKLSAISFSGVLIGENLKSITLGNALLFIGVIIIIIAVFLIGLWASINSLGGLIYALNHLDKKKKVTFIESFKIGKENFWQLLTVNILGKILIFSFLIITGILLSILLQHGSLLRSLSFLLSFIIFVSMALFISFMIIYSSAYIVLKKNTTLESIKNAWTLFKKNWVITIETAIIFFVFNIFLKVAIIITVTILAVPFLLLLLLSFIINITILAKILITLWITIVILALIMIATLFSTYQLVAWTLLFDKINKGGVLSKLHRIFSK